jgi:hypothetical protein
LRALLISDDNLNLLLKHYSIDEYTEFYETNFSVLPISIEQESSLDEIIYE